ncbi:MAG TPA: hypothetical protein VEC16_01725 [Alphaproteobacteria bacterium]|nr:hypothetical protein [Alphaproteobacteria bacterium]
MIGSLASFVFNIPEKYEVTFSKDYTKFYVNGKLLYDISKRDGTVRISLSQKGIDSFIDSFKEKLLEPDARLFLPLPPPYPLLGIGSVKNIESIVESDENNYLIKYNPPPISPRDIEKTALKAKDNYKLN